MSVLEPVTASAARASSNSATDQPSNGGLLLFSVFVAALLRFAALGRQPLWLDEATDAVFASRSFWNCVFAESVHPPLYRTLLHFVIASFGDSAASTRFLPALFGILAIPVAVALARQFSPRSEIPTVILITTSPFLIFFSQENRDYSLFILLTLVSTWAFFRIARSGHGLSLYCATCILLMYTHYLGAFVMLAHEIVYWLCDRRFVRGWILSRVVTVAAFAPWLVWAARAYHSESRLFVPPALLVPLTLLRFFVGYGIAAPDGLLKAEPWLQKIREEGIVVVPAFCLFAWLVWRGLRCATLQKNVKVFFAAIVLIPWAALLALAPWVQLAQERYLAFQCVFVLMIAGAGLASLASSPKRIVSAMVAVVISFSLVSYYAAPGELFRYRFRYGKENWAGAATFVRQENADLVILAPSFLQLPFNRYSQGKAREIETPLGSSAVPNLAGAHRVALVLSHAGKAEEELHSAMDAKYARVAEAVFSPQNMIRVTVYDTSRVQPTSQ
jgi:hypothetical protein